MISHDQRVWSCVTSNDTKDCFIFAILPPHLRRSMACSGRPVAEVHDGGDGGGRASRRRPSAEATRRAPWCRRRAAQRREECHNLPTDAESSCRPGRRGTRPGRQLRSRRRESAWSMPSSHARAGPPIVWPVTMRCNIVRLYSEKELQKNASLAPRNRSVPPLMHRVGARTLLARKCAARRRGGRSTCTPRPAAAVRWALAAVAMPTAVIDAAKVVICGDRQYGLHASRFAKYDGGTP